MRLICYWCSLLALATAQLAQDDGYYAPQTFRNHDDRGPVLFQPSRPWEVSSGVASRQQSYTGGNTNSIESYQNRGLFKPSRAEGPQSTINEPWRQIPVQEPWREPISHAAPAPIHRPEPWRAPLQLTKEQQALIIHHKQALTSDGGFQFEYASDNGLAAGETIEPDGTRVGSYQYKDPSGQLVKMKYRAGKEGFQIIEGTHLPKSPEPVQPQIQDQHYQHAYEQQRQQYELQQQHNLQRAPEQNWREQNQQYESGPRPAPANQQYSNWRPQEQEDDGQYRENDLDVNSRGPHTFGEGYSFAFQG